MANDRMTFGEHLRQFALSIDYIHPNDYETVQRHIRKYLEVQLSATQVALFEPTTVNDSPGMATVWSHPKFRVHQTLQLKSGKYRRQLAMAIGEKRNLWVLSESDDRLDSNNRGVDEWGKRKDNELPPFYISNNAQSSQTAIVMITKNSQGQLNGAFLIEINKMVRPSKVLKREMQLIAEAVGLLHASDLATREQREGTRKAISNLADILQEVKLDTGPRPLMFVASSSRAKDDVMESLEQVLNNFKDHIFVKHWHEMHQPGNINMQLVDEIRKAQYGICYLSEEVGKEGHSTKTGHQFADNPNVLVEAGMLHMVTVGATSSGTGWIPIRESESDEVPFDLENQRTILVERDKRGVLNRDQFESNLTAKISSLLETKLSPREKK